MPEDAGKKKFIKDFLQRVKAGEGFIEDIWIERVVRPPGSEGKGSTARSSSGGSVNNITQLLEDDLKNSFDEGYFTFRFVAALKGSGKTSLLTYLDELTKTKSTYEDFSVVNRFQLSDLLSSGGQQSFSVKLYCHILAQTFWELLKNSNSSIKDVAEEILKDYLGESKVTELKAKVEKNRPNPFRMKFFNDFAEIGVGFEEFFFEVIDEVSKTEPRCTFAYLIDELDSLQNFPNELQETRSLLKALIKRVSQKFNSKVRLFIYLVGTSENTKSFITEDPVIESLVGKSVITLSKGYGDEFEQIGAKIDDRIEGAFKGYQNFPMAWQEIKGISLNASKNLREFCQEYATAVLEIHEKYFKEEPEKSFEGNARELVEAQCRQKWERYLRQKSYSLSSVSTTTILAGHAFDCYIELKHNGSCVARGFGEAKNYELLSQHLETFNTWLKDANFKPTDDGSPPDVAFMIAPSCPSLLRRKLEIQNIDFIQSDKVVDPPNNNNNGSPGDDVEPKNNGSSQDNGAVNLNKADKQSIVMAMRGTRMKKTTIDKLMKRRKNKTYKDIDELAADLGSTPRLKAKIQEKLEDGKICF